MLRVPLAAALLVLPALAGAQVNTTGTISPNTTFAQGTTRAPATGVTTPGAATNGTTGGTATGTTTPGASTTTATDPTAAAPVPGAPRDAAIVVCGEDISTGANRLVVFNSSTSSGGPTIAPAAPCAQALADLFVAGFGIIDVQPVNQQLQYTLVR